LLLVAYLAIIANAQHTEAVCNVTELSWSFNSLQQSPCLVSAYLANPCSSDGDYDVVDIGPGFHYNPSDMPSVCECNTVVYNLFSACAACQNASIGPWTLYKENCTTTWPDGQYLLKIPEDTALPAWAYQQVEGTNRFNLTIAKSVGDVPENKTTPTSTSAQAQATNASGVSQPGKKSSVGPIVGGVVGGIAGILLIGTIFTFFVLRRQKRFSRGHTQQAQVTPYPSGSDSTSKVISNTKGGKGGSQSSNSAFLTGQQGHGSSMTSGSPQATMSQSTRSLFTVRPYNPDDPRTFPTGTELPSSPASSTGNPTLIGSALPLGMEVWRTDRDHRAEV